MKRSNPDEQQLIRYLLGELPENECAKIERRDLEDDEFSEMLEAIEAELAGDYARGALTGRRRKAFEQRLLAMPGSAEELELARLLAGTRKAENIQAAGRRTWLGASNFHIRFLQAASIALGIAVVIAIGLFALQRGKPALPAASPLAQVPFIPTFTLAEGGFRGEGRSNGIKIPPRSRFVRFRIAVRSNGYKRYNASLSRVENGPLFTQSNLQVSPSKSGEFLSIEVPAGVLSSGTFIMAITGVRGDHDIHEIAKYVITVQTNN